VHLNVIPTCSAGCPRTGWHERRFTPRIGTEQDRCLRRSMMRRAGGSVSYALREGGPVEGGGGAASPRPGRASGNAGTSAAAQGPGAAKSGASGGRTGAPIAAKSHCACAAPCSGSAPCVSPVVRPSVAECAIAPWWPWSAEAEPGARAANLASSGAVAGQGTRKNDACPSPSWAEAAIQPCGIVHWTHAAKAAKINQKRAMPERANRIGKGKSDS